VTLRRRASRVTRAGACAIAAFVAVLIQASFVGHFPSFADVSIAESRTFGAFNAVAGSTLSASPASATSAGDALVATIRVRNTLTKPAVISVTDSAGDTWVKAAAVTSGTQADGEIWYVATAGSILTSGSVTVTVGAGSAIAFTVLELTGASATPLDQVATSSGTSTVASSGTTPSTSQSSEIAVANIGWNATSTPSGQTAGYTTTSIEQATVSGSAAGEQAAWRLLSATGPQTYAATLSASAAWTGAIATFETNPTSTPTPSPTPTPTTTATATSTPTATPTPTPTPTSTPPPSAPHIMVIVEENTAFSSAQGTPFIIGNASAPYINSLASKYRSATHWFANQHISANDYLDLISGSNQGLSQGTKPPYSATTLVDELNAHRISWKAYMEGMPSACSTGGSTGLYESDHNPFVYFSDYKTLCSGGNGVVSYSQSLLSTDLNSATPPDFVWISPNACHDMHTTGGSCGKNPVANGDKWLSNNLPTVLSSKWYASGGIIIVTWDESVTSDTSGGSFGNGGKIATLVIAANAQGAYAASGDHYATLRGIEEAYGVGLLGNSANSSYGDLRPAF
jgi:phosphatidylinositol-3-phosphatase